MEKLPFNAQQHPAPKGIKVLDSIMISLRSSGTLNGGQYSEKISPPNIRLNISATNKSNVTSERKKLGSKDNYTLTYEINNQNDSPAFARLEII